MCHCTVIAYTTHTVTPCLENIFSLLSRDRVFTFTSWLVGILQKLFASYIASIMALYFALLVSSLMFTGRWCESIFGHQQSIKRLQCQFYHLSIFSSFSVVQTAPVFSGDRFTLACPGDTVQYSCHEMLADSTITWSFQCGNSQNKNTVSVQMPTTEVHSCQIDNGVMINFNFTFSYASKYNVSETWSGLSVTLLDTNYSVNRLFWLRIDCGDSSDFKYLNITGKVTLLGGIAACVEIYFRSGCLAQLVIKHSFIYFNCYRFSGLLTKCYEYW